MMTTFMKRAALVAGIAGGMMAAAPASAVTYVNVIQTNLITVGWSGPDGVLRAGSPWGPNSTASVAGTLHDGIFAPEGQQWNAGSFWWDQDPSVNPTPLNPTFYLNGTFTVSQLILQADDNDGYAIDYWDGAAWQLAWDFGDQPSYGLVTRPTAILSSPITTNTFRLRAYPGDKYYGVSEFQALVAQGVVPEPATWAMMILGFGVVGSAMRRTRRATAKLSYAR